MYSGWIGSGIIRFGSFRVRVYIGSRGVRVGSDSVRFVSGYGSQRVNTISGRFGFGSGHVRFEVKLGHYGFGSVRFWVGSISNFRLKSIQLFLLLVRIWFRIIRFGSIGSGHFFQVYVRVRASLLPENSYTYGLGFP